MTTGGGATHEPRPGRQWFVEDSDAHAFAPDLTRALWSAFRWEDPDENGRRSTKVMHEPPRLDAEGEGCAGTWLSVVDDENAVRSIRNVPDFSQARSVVGLDALAELYLAAQPATAQTDDGETVREKGRTFVGPDADVAEAVLASVRENHVAQDAGRYARNPSDPASGAIVYIHTDAAPTGFVDVEAPGVEWLATDTQRAIIDALAECPSATTRDLAEAVGCSEEPVHETLGPLADRGLVARHDRAAEHAPDVDAVCRRRLVGNHGADVYRNAGAEAAIVDLEEVGLSQVAHVTD